MQWHGCRLGEIRVLVLVTILLAMKFDWAMQLFCARTCSQVWPIDPRLGA